MVNPRPELSRRDNSDPEEHPAVVNAAQLSTPADPGTSLNGGYREVVGESRYNVALELEWVHPERVDHVDRGQVELHRLVLRNHQLRQVLDLRVRIPRRAGHGDHLIGAARAGHRELRVLEFPAPLEPGDIDDYLGMFR